LPIPLIKEEEKKSLGYKGAELLNTKPYSHGIKALKCFAPAIPQRAALLLMEEIIKAGMDATFFNTLAFLSFQSSQAVRSSKDVMPFRCEPWVPEIAHHHS
jgi:hypothetical protein